MAAQGGSAAFFNTAVSAWNKANRFTLLLALANGYLNSASALVFWFTGTTSSLALWIDGGIGLLLITFTTYVIVKDLTGGGPFRITEWLWLAGSTLALVSVLGITIGAAYGLKLALGTSVSAPALILLACISLLALMFFPAWPVAQMRTGRLINPWRIFRATKGYRWGLVLAFFVPGPVDKIAPPIGASTSVPDALFRFILDGLIGTVVMLVMCSIAATAWRFACLRDPTLQVRRHP
jgi:hypothetical protein